MKQIEYTEKQLIVLEVLKEVDKLFKPSDIEYDFIKAEYFAKIQKIKKTFGIQEKYLTLRQYINKKGCGAYHRFYFSIKGLNVSNICDVDDFEQLYNPSLLDQYYVLKDTTKEFGSNCENYCCDHYLELVEKED